MRFPLPARQSLTANAGCESRSDSAGGDQLPPLATLELILSLRSRRLFGVDASGSEGDDEEDDSLCVIWAREMEHMNCSNSTAAQLSGVSAVVVAVAGGEDVSSNDDPLSSALLTSSDEAEPDRRYLCVT